MAQDITPVENFTSDVQRVYTTNDLPQLHNLTTYMDKALLLREDNLPAKLLAKITIRQQWSILAEIKESLDDWELDLFRKSCFGHFLDLDPKWLQGGKKDGKRTTFVAQLVHFFLLRRMQTLKENEMWFLVKGKPVRFSLTEFAMVTGLRCSSIPESSSEQFLSFKDRLRDLYFDGKSSVNRDELAQVFRNMSDEGDTGKKTKRKKKKAGKKGQEREDRVKLALLYFLEGVLLGKDASRSISNLHLSMVDDLDMFNTYPWGRTVYGDTFESLSKKDLVSKYKKKLTKPMEEQVKASYELLGFPFAFQIWAFEAIPFLGNKCASRAEEMRFPRCLNWKCRDEIIKMETIISASRDNNLVVHSILHPSRDEKAKAYMVDIEQLHDVKDDVITTLETLLGSGATIQDEAMALPASIGVDSVVSAALATSSPAMSSTLAASDTIATPISSFRPSSKSSTIAASLASQSQSTAALHSFGELPSDGVRMTEDVGNKTSEHSSSASEVFDGYAFDHTAFAELASDELGLCSVFKKLIPCPQKGLSVQNCHFINLILLKYGDITKGSILKSVEARTPFLKLVAEVVALLFNNSLETIGAQELEKMKNWTDEAAAVGFRVDWLQQRIKWVSINSKIQKSFVRADEIVKEMDAVKLAWSKLNLELMNLKKDVDIMKAEIHENEFSRSHLCEGLL